MIYIDSAVLLASAFAEPRSPPAALWDENLGSSRLLAYEVWTRIHAYGVAASHGNLTAARLSRVSLTELGQSVLARALQPFPVPVRPLDALHLATMDYLRRQGEAVELASYDNRLIAAAEALGIPIATL